MSNIEKEEIKELTYEEYLEVLKKFSGKFFKVTPKEEVNNEHDKTFKIILENKKEAVNLINKVVEFDKKIQEEELEKYNKNFITQNLKIQEADIVYKLKNKKVFILIEQQTKVDYSMAYRILNYQLEIIRNCIEEKKVKNKSYEHALVIAIVLYTGQRKWTAKRDIQEIQENINLHTKVPMLENYYYLVDINNYTKEELFIEKSFLSKIMLLEKSENKEELLKNLYKIIPIIKEENIETLIRIVKYAYGKYLDKEMVKNIINKIKKEGVGNMLASVEMLERERRKYIKTGRQEEKVNLAKKMIKEKFSIEMVEKITGLKREKFM